MQLKLLFVFVFLGAHLSQISAHPTNNKSIIGDVIQEAKELYEKVSAFIEEKIQSSIEILEEIRNKLMEDALNVIKAVKTELQNIISNAKEAIEQIKQDAAELGMDISNCLKDNEEQFDTLFKELLQNEGECVQNEVDSGWEIINNALVVFGEAIQTINSLPARLKECQNIKCAIEIINEIIKMKQELPEEINKIDDQIEEFVEKFEERIQVCSSQVIIDAGLKTAEIVNDVAKCAAGRKYDIACPS